MTTILVMFNLKSGVSEADYEEWAKRSDLPMVRSLRSISDVKLLKSLGVLGTDYRPPYQYVELVEVLDMLQFQNDITHPDVQIVAAEFRKFADDPIFVPTVQLD